MEGFVEIPPFYYKIGLDFFRQIVYTLKVVYETYAGVMEWQTCRTQNAIRKGVGSSPTTSTNTEKNRFVMRVFDSIHVEELLVGDFYMYFFAYID